jgi:dnd system-associated protein 4
MTNSSVRVNYQKTDIYEFLVDEYEVFDTYVDFFMFAASLGYYRDEYAPDGDSGENEMLWMHIRKQEYYRVVAASIAYQHTGDAEALVSPDEQLPILARYAAGGAQVAAQEFGEIAGDPTDSVVNFLQNVHSEEEQDEEEEILKKVREDFDDSLFGES